MKSTLKKRVLAFAVIFVICLTASSQVAFARGASTDKYELAEKIVDEANDQIALVVRIAQQTQRDDALWAVMVTNRLARNAINQARRLGVIVICEYDLYIIDGHFVLIDPLKVINY